MAKTVNARMTEPHKNRISRTVGGGMILSSYLPSGNNVPNLFVGHDHLAIRHEDAFPSPFCAACSKRNAIMRKVNAAVSSRL